MRLCVQAAAREAAEHEAQRQAEELRQREEDLLSLQEKLAQAQREAEEKQAQYLQAMATPQAHHVKEHDDQDESEETENNREYGKPICHPVYPDRECLLSAVHSFSVGGCVCIVTSQFENKGLELKALPVLLPVLLVNLMIEYCYIFVTWMAFMSFDLVGPLKH